jgi:hypothetical protein
MATRKHRSRKNRTKKQRGGFWPFTTDTTEKKDTTEPAKKGWFSNWFSSSSNPPIVDKPEIKNDKNPPKEAPKEGPKEDEIRPPEKEGPEGGKKQKGGRKRKHR